MGYHRNKTVQDFFVNKLDLFGRKVTLTIDKKGDEHKTLVGAIVSIIVYVIYFNYVH